MTREQLTPEQRTFLEDKRFAVVGSKNPDGSPHLAVMWYLLDGDDIVVNSAQGRLKDRNGPRDFAQAQKFSDELTADIVGDPLVLPRGIVTTGSALAANKRVVRFFVSYAHENKDLAEKLLVDLVTRQVAGGGQLDAILEHQHHLPRGGAGHAQARDMRLHTLRKGRHHLLLGHPVRRRNNQPDPRGHDHAFSRSPARSRRGKTSSRKNGNSSI